MYPAEKVGHQFQDVKAQITTSVIYIWWPGRPMYNNHFIIDKKKTKKIIMGIGNPISI